MSPPGATEVKRVLIANRGEIALRIVRACRDAGMASIAVYAGPDEDAPYAVLADEAVPLPGAGPADTYLTPGSCWPPRSRPVPTPCTPGTDSWPRTLTSPRPSWKPA